MLANGDKNWGIGLKVLLCTFLLVAFAHKSPGQTLNVNVTNVPATALNTPTKKNAGYTKSNYLSIHVVKGYFFLKNWKVTVQAVGTDYENATTSATIGVNHTAFQYNHNDQNAPYNARLIPDNTGPIYLGASEKTLISGAGFGVDHTFTRDSATWFYDFIIDGGSHLFVDEGNYVVTLQFKLYNNSSQLVDTKTQAINFPIQNTASATISLQNGGNNVGFQFQTISDYQSGMTINKNQSLHVECYRPNEVQVKATIVNLTSSTTSDVIPVSFIHLKAIQNSVPNLVLNSIALSGSNQVLIQNPNANASYNKVTYGLQYSIHANDAQSLFSKKPAAYTTTIIFTVISQ
jgi:hypothetical protein